MGKTQHGHATEDGRSRAYMIWVTMRQRCENEKARDYWTYGGRGIYVCEDWKRFDNFLSDMGEPPAGMTLERKENDGPYSKKNCEWATRSQQQRNRRTARTFEVNGVVRNVCDIEAELGLSQGAIWHRLKDGWPLDRAITTRKQA